MTNILSQENKEVVDQIRESIRKYELITDSLLKKVCDSFYDDNNLDNQNNQNNQDNLYNYLINEGLISENILFERICEYYGVAKIKHAINKLRMKLTRYHLQIILSRYNKHNNCNLIEKWKSEYRTKQRRFGLSKGSSRNLSSTDIDDIIEYFILNGYEITDQDIILMTLNEKEINDFDRFNIVLDNKFLELCNRVNFYPNYPIVRENEEICKLQWLTDTQNLTSIKKFFKHYNIVPNNICMENACARSSNSKTIKYLLSKGGKINTKCMENIVKCEGHEIIWLVFDEFKKNCL